MGLDLYAGTLTRYYGKNWKTATQQWAEANGMTYQKIETTPPEEDDLSPEDVCAIVSHWRDSLLEALAPSGGECVPWTEDNEADYFTVKPDWPAYGALLLYAAAKVYGEPYPATVAKDWDFAQEPLVRRAMEDPQLNWSLFKGAQWWLPLEHPLMLTGETPTGDRIPMASSAALLLELLRINELGWKADEEAVLAWEHTEGYPADGEIRDGRLEEVTGHTEYSTVSLARYAYSLFWQSVKFSLQHKVPLLMDF